MLGKDQAKSAKKGAALVNKAEIENRDRAIATEAAGLDDLDSSLASALGQYDEGQRGATDALNPYAAAGTQALSQQADLMGLNGPEAQAAAKAKFTTDPGYEFRLSQGVNALDRSATAAGGLYSGAAGKALSDYGQQTGSAEYGSYYDRLSGLATNGQNAATNISSTLSDFAKSKASAYLGTGQNQANLRLSTLPHITGANTNAATATATGLKQAADAKAAGAGNLLDFGIKGAKVLSGWGT